MATDGQSVFKLLRSGPHYSASVLAGLPGLPTDATSIKRKAKREGWPARQRKGRGGGEEWPQSALPPLTQIALGCVSASEAVESLRLEMKRIDGELDALLRIRQQLRRRLGSILNG